MHIVPWLTAVLTFLAILAIILTIWTIKAFSSRSSFAPRRSQSIPWYYTIPPVPRHPSGPRGPPTRTQISQYLPPRILSVAATTSQDYEMIGVGMGRAAYWLGTANLPILPSHASSRGTPGLR